LLPPRAFSCETDGPAAARIPKDQTNLSVETMTQMESAAATRTGRRNGAADATAPEQLRALYRSMQRIRRFEEVIGDCAAAAEFRGPTHLYVGQEAVAVGVCAALRRDDYVFGGHRSHGHYLAKGGEIRALAAEIFARETGCSRGRGGSMHLTAPEVGLLGTSALVGGGIGTGVGVALASVLQRNDRVTAIFFGDGAVEEGVFHESLNFAALKKLPVLFVCENNLYSSHLPIHTRQPRGEIYAHAAPYGIAGERLDGNDVLAVKRSARAAVERARAGGGPSLLECMTYRWRGHVGPKWDIDKGLRTQEEVDEWVARCPIKRFRSDLDERGVRRDDLARIDAEVEEEVADAIAFARSSPFPEAADLLKYVHTERE
jgi:acetoin:2,6-dichlorophenolindophenol oxidoreductase subunit alpha